MDTIYGKMFDIPCRIAYPQIGWTDEDIAKRQAKRKGKAKAYKDKKTNVTLLIPKSDKKTFKRIMQQLLDVSGLDSVEEITQHPFINKDGDWRDGSDPEYADKAGFVGNLFCKVGSNKPVAMEMVDSKGNRVEVPFEKAKDVFYPGANCVVIVQAAAMDGDDEGDVNVAFYLKAIMRLDDKAPRLDGDSAATTALFQGYAASGASDEEEEEEEAPKTSRKPRKAAPVDTDDEEEEETPKTSSKKSKKAAPVEDEEEEEQEAPKAVTKSKKTSLSDILDAD